MELLQSSVGRLKIVANKVRAERRANSSLYAVQDKHFVEWGQSSKIQVLRNYAIAPVVVIAMILAACSAPGPAPSVSVNAAASTPATATPPTNRPTDQPTAEPTAQPTAEPTREAAQLVRLMEGACCASPGWYADSENILFIDKPAADAPTGIYRVDINAPGKSELWSERVAFYTREYDYAQIPEQAGTRLIRVSDGKELRVRNGGRQVSLSPDRTRIVWTETRETFPIENRVSNIMLAPIDFEGKGVGEAQRITQILRGGVSGWLDDNRLLLNGRLTGDTNDSTTFVYDLPTGQQTVIVTAERTRLTAVSRAASWIAYAIVSDADASRNGLWVIRTDGTNAKKLDMFGAAQWRDDTHLIIAPLEMGAASHAFYEYDVATGQTRRLTPPSQPFKIASGDWTVSPDGGKIVFVSAEDNNLWLWKFNEQ